MQFSVERANSSVFVVFFLFVHLLKFSVCVLFSSFFASYAAMNEYCGDRNVSRKLSTVDGNFRRLPSPLVNRKLTLINLKYTCARI